jgi:hypothetical protein
VTERPVHLKDHCMVMTALVAFSCLLLCTRYIDRLVCLRFALLAEEESEYGPNHSTPPGISIVKVMTAVFL